MSFRVFPRYQVTSEIGPEGSFSTGGAAFLNVSKPDAMFLVGRGWISLTSFGEPTGTREVKCGATAARPACRDGYDHGTLFADTTTGFVHFWNGHEWLNAITGA
jgi:hypothetical protein